MIGTHSLFTWTIPKCPKSSKPTINGTLSSSTTSKPHITTHQTAGQRFSTLTYNALHGFAVSLSPPERESLKKVRSFVSLYPDKLVALDTYSYSRFPLSQPPPLAYGQHQAMEKASSLVLSTAVFGQRAKASTTTT